ncbi:MAG: hypothetical protein ABIU95_12835 [Burkholderiales bacterium]
MIIDHDTQAPVATDAREAGASGPRSRIDGCRRPAASEYPTWVVALCLVIAAVPFCSWLGVTAPLCTNACVFNWVAGLAAAGFLYIGLHYWFGRLRALDGNNKRVLALAIVLAVVAAVVLSPRSGFAAPVADEPAWLLFAVLGLATLIAVVRR